MIELLAPAGTKEKLLTAFNFGADAVYFAGKKYGLRAFAGNFENNEIKDAAQLAHSLGKKVYVTLNILAHEDDFDGLYEYLQHLENAKVDAVIISDLGLLSFVHKHAPKLEIHVSTQANILNSYAINFLAEMGVKRIILARELSIDEIKKIKSKIPDNIELECFVHGSMCISYSGRCLLSNYICGRDSNRGACAQPCRWEYSITEKSRQGEHYEIQEDARGTYILNSKDMKTIRYLQELIKAGISSFKIEGRMKTEYYVANVVNAYRRALDNIDNANVELLDVLDNELEKSSHRKYTTGFLFNDLQKEYMENSSSKQTYEYCAHVLTEQQNGFVFVEMKNRFKVGDVLEVLSPTNTFNSTLIVSKMENENGEDVQDAFLVQQKLKLFTNLPLKKGDMLRKQIKEK